MTIDSTMSNNRIISYQASRSVQFSQSNAPIDLRMAAWALLTDFENWPAWMPGVDKASLLDSGEPGRGSLIQLNCGRTTVDWLIDYWSPLNRIDFIVNDHGRRKAYSYNISSAQGNSRLDLTLDAEFELRSYQRLIAALFSWVDRRKTDRILDRLQQDLLSMSI